MYSSWIVDEPDLRQSIQEWAEADHIPSNCLKTLPQNLLNLLLNTSSHL